MSATTPGTTNSTTAGFPDYLTVSAAELGQGTPVQVRVLGDLASVGRDMAEARRHLDAFDFLLGCELDLCRVR